MNLDRKTNGTYDIQLLVRPNRKLSEGSFEHLASEVREVAATCFDELPEYQIIRGTRRSYDDKVVAVAWRADGKMAGFCSCLLIQVPEVGEVLHLGLTCVRPEDRGAGLTHKLTRKAVAGTLLRRRPVGRLWVSNCAAVLSSLGNVAMHFHKVYPSPFTTTPPSEKHLKIARLIDREYRDEIFIHPDAHFDADDFVMRGSVAGTVFEKEEGDSRFHHRQNSLNEFYKGLMDFSNGDEVLQIGYASAFAAVRHVVGRKKSRHRKAVPGTRKVLRGKKRSHPIAL